MAKADENILFAMYDETMDDQLGHVAIATGACNISADKPHPTLGKNCLFTQSGSRLTYTDQGLAFGVTDFTVDFWMYYQSGYSGVSTMYVYSPDGLTIQPDCIIIGHGSGDTDATVVNLDGGYKSGKWAHYAITQKAGICYYFVDGKRINSAKNTVSLVSNSISVNGRYVNVFPGGPAYYKAVRACNFARWTENFTPPARRQDYVRLEEYLYLNGNEVYGMKEVR